MTELKCANIEAMTAIEELVAIEACVLKELRIEKDQDASSPIGTTCVVEDTLMFDNWHHEVSDFYYVTS